MSLLDDVRKIDPEPDLLNTFEKKALSACKEYVDNVIRTMKHDIQQKQYVTTHTHKQWSRMFPLIVYKYDDRHSFYGEFWEIRYDPECAYGANYIFYKYATSSQEKAEHLSKLVVNALMREGFSCEVSKNVESYSRGLLIKQKWGSVGYCIDVSFNW